MNPTVWWRLRLSLRQVNDGNLTNFFLSAYNYEKGNLVDINAVGQWAVQERQKDGWGYRVLHMSAVEC